MARNVLIFSDGTGQTGGLTVDERRSNIYKLYRATRVAPDSVIDPDEQVAYYDAGVGSLPPRGGTFAGLVRMAHNFLSQATGFGLTTNIIDCYESIIRLWRPGDRIFLFGFSRGAYTVRCLGGVLAHCGIPTRLENGAPMKYDSATARRLATIAVKHVYQHTASRPLAKATLRQKDLMDQRSELARQFRETYAARQDDGSDYPFFIGVFDTVAAMASKGALSILCAVILALAAVIATALWAAQPAAGRFFGPAAGGGAPWWPWFWAVLGGFALITFVWYVITQIKFAPRANPKNPLRTLNISFQRMRFEDLTLNDNVHYARHAISIDENRAAFKRVGWGSSQAGRPDKDGQGIDTFEQYWFAGIHSDVGGGYAENESRLSDITMGWMIDAAEKIKGGIKIDRSVLNLHPSPAGMQHDQRKQGFPLLTSLFRLTWQGKARTIPGPLTTLHETVYERFKLPAVVQYDIAAPYRPETLRMHERLADYFNDIPAPPSHNRFAAWVRSFLLTG